MTNEQTTITEEQLDELERVSIIRRAQTPPENGPAITIECDTFDALITALRQARAELDTARGLCGQAHIVIDAYAAYHAHVDGIECPLCSVGKDGACQIADDLDTAIANANNAYAAARAARAREREAAERAASAYRNWKAEADMDRASCYERDMHDALASLDALTATDGEETTDDH